MAEATRLPLLARLLKSGAAIEPVEMRAVVISMLYFFFLFGSYAIVKPVRDAMGTVYGVKHYQDLFTATFIGTLIVAPLYSGFASRLRLSAFLPWVYGFIAVTILVFYALFSHHEAPTRWLAAAFYVWVSVFNMLIISVFWTFMSDIFSRTQAKRLYGFIAAGGTIGGITGPALASLFATVVGNPGLMLISACGFGVTAGLVVLLERERQRLIVAGADAQRTRLDHRLGGNPFDGFKLLLQSRYLLMLALFLFLMTWISTIVYFQLGDLISKDFVSHAARTRVYAIIEVAVNGLAVVIQLLGTGRFIRRFGVTTGLLLNPVIMVLAFLAIAFSPILLVLGGMQVLRRVAEYAVAKPTREMLFTVVDQESKYKAKNVIDTVVYRGGDVCASWASSFVLSFGVSGLAIFGAIVSLIWFPVAWALGRRYENVRGGELATTAPSTPAAAG
ncbi:MAG: NTP/NDP exchange transporter [Steroidobacteraceae bacterium]